MKALLSSVGLGLVLLGVSSSPARADFGGVPDRIWIDLGGSTNDLSTTAALTGQSGVGAVLDFEDVFDLPGSKDTFRGFITWRISESRKYMDFGFVSINRSGGRIIQNDFNWGDYAFAAGARVDATFDTRFIYAAYRYDFLNEEKVRISGSAGASITTLKAALTGDGNVTGPSGPIAGDFTAESKITAPVPMLGLNLDWAITQRLFMRTYTRFFWLNISSVDGSMKENGIHLNWLFTKHFGAGLGFDRNNIRIKEVEINQDDKAKFNYDVSGFALYLNFAW
ncbi:MAG TPA: hypothetical protein VJ826_08175 [Candidatus Polarisedimenticolaceae bacterium]|nr:hypothetical protein [Candidatus Polarisedimenticolaceae bacterium]